MQNSGWHNSQDGIKRSGGIISFVAILFISGATYSFPFLIRLVLLIGTLLIIRILIDASYRNNANCIHNSYFVEIDDAIQIVENILNAKYFPFRREDDGEKVHLYLDKDGVELVLTPFAPNSRGFGIGFARTASHIKICSTNVENDLLVQNLKQKLDDGFAPKGL